MTFKCLMKPLKGFMKSLPWKTALLRTIRTLLHPLRTSLWPSRSLWRPLRISWRPLKALWQLWRGSHGPSGSSYNAVKFPSEALRAWFLEGIPRTMHKWQMVVGGSKQPLCVAHWMWRDWMGDLATFPITCRHALVVERGLWRVLLRGDRFHMCAYRASCVVRNNKSTSDKSIHRKSVCSVSNRGLLSGSLKGLCKNLYAPLKGM